MHKGRDVGELGEVTLDAWATEVGAVSQRVTRDTRGWDRLLEFTWPDFDGPFDRRPGTPRVFIQVKSSDQKTKSWPIKLTNLESFVKEPAPAFFLLLHFDNESQPQRAFLVHVDESLMRRVLKKLRETTEDKKAEDLHKERLPIKFTDEHELPEANGVSLLKTIKDAVGENIHSYQEKKLQNIRELGYEERLNEVKVSFVSPKAYKDKNHGLLVDIVLGLVDSVDDVSVKAFDTRFDISIEDPELSAEKALVAFSPRFEAVQLEIRRLDGTDNMGMEGQLFSTLGVHHLIPKEAHGFRAVTPFLEATAMISEGLKLNLKFETDVEYSLEELLKLTKILELFGSAAKLGETLELYIGEPVDARARLEPKSVVDSSPDFEQIRALLSDFKTVVKSSDVDLKERTTITAVFRQLNKIYVLAALMKAEKLNISYEANIPKDADISRTCIAVLPVSLVIGQTSVVGVVLLRGRPSLINDDGEGIKINIDSSDAKLALLTHIKTEDLTPEILKGLQQRTAENLDSECPIIYGTEPIV